MQHARQAQLGTCRSNQLCATTCNKWKGPFCCGSDGPAIYPELTELTWRQFGYAFIASIGLVLPVLCFLLDLTKVALHLQGHDTLAVS